MKIINLNKIFKIGVLIALMLISFLSVASEITIDELGSYGERPVHKSMSCYGQKVSFVRGRDLKPRFNISGTNIPLQQSCYSSMSCVSYRGNPAILVVEAPACGGNAVPEDYLVFDLQTKSQTQLTYQAAKKAKIINY
jgi:hypothetical protein